MLKLFLNISISPIAMKARNTTVLDLVTTDIYSDKLKKGENYATQI